MKKSSSVETKDFIGSTSYRCGPTIMDMCVCVCQEQKELCSKTLEKFVVRKRPTDVRRKRTHD